jgi:hypothetical protein
MLSFQNLFSALPGTPNTLRSLLGLSAPTLEVDAGIVAPNFLSSVVTLTDGAAVAVNAALGGRFILTCANNNAREISVPTNGVAGQRIEVVIINTSGGNLTVTTFAAAIRQPALTLPATATQREFTLVFQGGTWGIYNFSPANVPN